MSRALSSCVFILMGAVMRDAILGHVTIGVHRPFLQQAGPTDDFEATYRATRTILEKYFDYMHVSKELLDLMYSVPPEKMRILSEDEVSRFFPLMDPVYEEIRTTQAASRHGISNLEYRRRKVAAEECYSHFLNGNVDDYENCGESIMWGLRLDEYLARKAAVEVICADRNQKNSPPTIPAELSERECQAYIMQKGH